MDIIGFFISSGEEATSSPAGCGCFIFALIAAGFLVHGCINGCNTVKSKVIEDLGYITTSEELLVYNNIEIVPIDKQSGYLPANTDLKIRKVIKKDNITWLSVYALDVDNQPITFFVLIPERIKNLQSINNYFVFNRSSDIWNNYYLSIDKLNIDIKNKYAQEFENSLRNIDISIGEGNILKESIKDTHFIFPLKGYLDLYVSDGSYFYYIPLEQKQYFLQQYKVFVNDYTRAIIPYFPNTNMFINLKQRIP
jgi:hypothetical protein